MGGGVARLRSRRTRSPGGGCAALLEAEGALALGASGTNSGILHTGFDSRPGEPQTRLILRAAALRGAAARGAGRADVEVRARACATVRAARGGSHRSAGRDAAVNGVETRLEADGSLRVPGEAVTDPDRVRRALPRRCRGRRRAGMH